MGRKHSRERKAAVDFMLLLLVVGIVLGIIVFWDYFSLVTQLAKIRGKLDIFIANDDTGTELAGLLGAKSADVRHMELLGWYTAGGLAEEKAQALEPLKSTLDSAYANYDFAFTGGGREIKYGKGVPPAMQDQSKQAITGCGTSLSDDITKLIRDSGGLQWPSDSKAVTSGFGGRELKKGACDCHGGIDIGAGVGTNVYAAHSGIVSKAAAGCPEGNEGCNSGYGNYIVIQDLSGKFYTLYAHLSSINKNEKDEVTKGALIGKSGNTGYSLGPHLHFQLSSTDKFLDRYSVSPCGLLDIAGVQGSCEHAKVAACSYVSGAPGITVRNYDTDIPLPGAKSGTARGTIIFKQWD